MHQQTCDSYLSGMIGLAEDLKALSDGQGAAIARLLKLDIDLLSVSALLAGFIEDDLRRRNDPLQERARGLHLLLAHAIRVKVDALGPLALDAGSPPAAR